MKLQRERPEEVVELVFGQKGIVRECNDPATVSRVSGGTKVGRSGLEM
jgi:hypothetical protein